MFLSRTRMNVYIRQTFDVNCHLFRLCPKRTLQIKKGHLVFFLDEIETDNLTVSNSEIITFDFTVSKNRIFVK